jgi:hypothetical protein
VKWAALATVEEKETVPEARAQEAMAAVHTRGSES